MPRLAALVRGANLALMRESEADIEASFGMLESVGLVMSFDHQGQQYLCSLDWQEYQKVRFPRKSYLPTPPAEVLRKCCAETRAFFGRKTEKSPGLTRVSHRLTANASTPSLSSVPEGESEGGAAAPSFGPLELSGLWNDAVDEAGADFPQVKQVSGTRRKHAAARLAEHPEEDWWAAYFKRIAGSDFLCGRTPRAHGHESWRPDFDWVLMPANMTKILEGKYDNRGGPMMGAGKTSGNLAALQTVLNRERGTDGLDGLGEGRLLPAPRRSGRDAG
jgi:hypothetical protein